MNTALADSPHSTAKVPSKKLLWRSLPGIVLCTACLLPYLNKAFTIDDPFFLNQAEFILKSPMHPTLMPMCWSFDSLCGPVAGIAPNNLLMSYYLLPVVLTGSHEWAAHVMQLLTLWSAIIATVSLALRIGFGPFDAAAAGLIFASFPPVLAMASTAMPDILAMSLGVIGIERFLAWKNDGRVINGVISALALALAGFTRMHMILLVICAALLLRDDMRILDVRSWFALKVRWWPIACALLVFGTLHILTRESGKTIAPGQVYMGLSWFPRNLRSYLLYWITDFPLGLAWLVFRNRRFKLWLLILPCVLGLAQLLIRPTFSIWFTLGSGLGLAVLIDIFLWAFESGKQWHIVSAVWLLCPLVVLFYIHLPVKYLIGSAPVIAFLIVENLPKSGRKAAVAAVAAVSVVYGIMVLHADYDFADMGRQAAAKIVAPQVAAGHRVWLSSQWGFQWYGLRAGARLLTTSDIPTHGDYLVRGDMEGWSETLKRLPSATLVETYTISGPQGRTMSYKDRAGLYSNAWGDLMWAWGRGEWNHYELWRFQ